MSDPSKHPRTPLRDIVIAGAGIAGATLALGLKRLAGADLDIVLCDPDLGSENPKPATLRAVAVAPDTRRHLDHLGVWAALADEAQPIRRMVITDGRPGLLPHPDLLTLTDPASHPVAHMVLADPLRAALLEACSRAGVRFSPARIRTVRTEASHLVLTPDGGEPLHTRLLAAADGGRSRLRGLARIQTLGRAYPETAIVATLQHAVDHGGDAVQHFLPAGPIALLPLRAADGTGRRTSIVWVERHDEAARLAALAPAAFMAALEERVGRDRNFTALEDRPRTFPLTLMLARRLVAPRFALLGDAARVIHPLAGQGLNLGLRDAAVLTEQIGGAVDLGLDPGSPTVLSAYERERRPDAMLMAGLTDSLDRLFSNDRPVMRFLRDVGLGLVHRAPAITGRLIRSAGGARET